MAQMYCRYAERWCRSMTMQIYEERTFEDWAHVNARHSRQRPLLTLVRILASISVATTPNLMVSNVQRCPKTRRRNSHVVSETLRS